MKVLILGSGGREHALAWKLRQSQHVTWLGVAPGNGGTQALAENIPISATDIEKIVEYVRVNEINLIVVGPEGPLADGIADRIDPTNHLVFGPGAEAARIESDKRYAKDVMTAAGVPTAAYRAFNDPGEAKAYVRQQGAPIVVKATGLAAGKGVAVCNKVEAAELAIDMIMIDKTFGDAGREIVIEEYLKGEEVSLLAITDGTDFLLLPPSQDHKQVGEGDTGPNTGGMGAICPTPAMTSDLVQRCAKEVFEPVLRHMRENGTPYRGVLYAGMMLTGDGPKVLEFNCRFGDPETQAVLPMVSVDLVDLMLVSVVGKLGEMMGQLNLSSTDWERISRTGAAASVVLAAEGYPSGYKKGYPITNIPQDTDSTMLFHAGTDWKNDRLVTAGGRVLATTARAGNLKDALEAAYRMADEIQFENKYMRRDIGLHALKKDE
ncbi:phosphoribosylamine--glycine ligase [bacterium]|nr:phosphoribosylamine--glycine ligase [bacterium]